MHNVAVFSVWEIPEAQAVADWRYTPEAPGTRHFLAEVVVDGRRVTGHFRLSPEEMNAIIVAGQDPTSDTVLDVVETYIGVQLEQTGLEDAPCIGSY